MNVRLRRVVVSCSMVMATAVALPCAIALAQAPAAVEQASWTLVEDEWFVMEIGGGKVGWLNSTLESQGDLLRTTTKSEMKIGRGAAQVEISSNTVFLETAQGKPISLESEQKMSAQPMRSTMEFRDDKIVHTTMQGEKKMSRDLPLPEQEWLPLQAAERFAREQREAGAESFSYKTISAETGAKVVTVTSKRVGEEELEIDGKAVPVTVWKTRTDVLPVEATEKYDAEFNMLQNELPMLGGIVTRRSTKESALGHAEGPAPELLTSTFITPDKPIDDPMKATSATLRLRMKSGDAPEFPTAGAQRVQTHDQGVVVLKIDINNNVPASAEYLDNAEYLAASSMVDGDDPLVKKLAAGALKRAEASDADTMTRAEALRRFVYRHISRKGMQTAFASASETAKTREGDCSEHGVLLCALLRAEGIPARVAAGLVYADAFSGGEGIFGWHMWTQALVDGKWVDFDATLPVRYNAGHVLTSTSSLEEGVAGTDLVSMVPLIGNLEIDVVDVAYASE